MVESLHGKSHEDASPTLETLSESKETPEHKLPESPLWQDPRFADRVALYTPPPVDMQQTVEKSYAEHGLGEDTVRSVNAGYPEQGRTRNCAEVSRAVAQTIDDNPQAAAKLDPRLPGESLLLPGGCRRSSGRRPERPRRSYGYGPALDTQH